MTSESSDEWMNCKAKPSEGEEAFGRVKIKKSMKIYIYLLENLHESILFVFFSSFCYDFIWS